MSHQTGIEASEELRSFIAQSKDGDVRLFKVSIDTAVKPETLVLSHSDPPSGTWEDDYDRLLLRQLEPKQPCYVLYRLDSKNNQGYEWVYISYSPDQAPVRQKMLYAATRSTMKKEFGGGHIKEELFGTTVEDVKFSGYKRHLTSQGAPAPLTMAEEELQHIKRTETNTHISVDTKHQTMQGVAFPISQEALDKMMELKNGNLSYVQLSLDIEKEQINLESFEGTTAKDLHKRIPTDHARYHFFMYDHSHEGDFLSNIVFIYSMPGFKSSIKERMLYSSCKAPLIDVAEQHVGMEIVRKLEVDEPKEVTEEYLYNELHPVKNVATQKFAKPKGPAGRGPRRITKPKAEEQ